MTRSQRRPDLVAVSVLSMALIAWILGPGWWSPIVGVTLIGFGPGYLLLNGAAHTVPDRLIRVALYVGTSLAISALVGLALSGLGIVMSYISFASAHLVIAVALFATHELEAWQGAQDVQDRHQNRKSDRTAFVRGSLLVAVPFLASWALLASSPVRTAPTTELYFAGTGVEIGGLPTTYQPPGPLELRVVATLGTPATNETLEIRANGRTIDVWQIPSGSLTVERLVTVDTSRLEAGPLRIEARLASSDRARSMVWLNLVEAS